MKYRQKALNSIVAIYFDGGNIVEVIEFIRGIVNKVIGTRHESEFLIRGQGPHGYKTIHALGICFVKRYQWLVYDGVGFLSMYDIQFRERYETSREATK